MLRAGWARTDFTPTDSVPLAGYGHLRDRMSTGVRDPVYCRAFAFEQGTTRVVLIIFDLLMVTEELHQELRRRLADTGAEIIGHATHTHSSVGGFASGTLIERVCGRHRPGVLDALANAGERAARAAIGSMKPAGISVSFGELAGHNGNRRAPHGPVDEELTVLSIQSGGERALLVSYSAHPVIVAERAHMVVSADFPGLLIRELEREVSFAAFAQGALGGVDVLFPEDRHISVDENLRRMVGPMVAEVLGLAPGSAEHKPDALLRFDRCEWPLGAPDVQPFYENQPFAPILAWPVKPLLNALFRQAQVPVARVQGFRLGDFAFVGTPADLGVGIDLAAKKYARDRGLRCPVVASQCDGYIGYLHRRQDYEAHPPSGPWPFKGTDAMNMGVYENALSVYGRDAGERALDAACSVIDELSV